MRIPNRDSIRKALDKTGVFSKKFGSAKLVISKIHGEFWIKMIESGEKTRLWIYRRERIALDRFEEQAESLRR